jgi:hypothetical protein
LVIEHMRNSVRGVKAMRRSALAQPQAWRTSVLAVAQHGDRAARAG